MAAANHFLQTYTLRVEYTREGSKAFRESEMKRRRVPKRLVPAPDALRPLPLYDGATHLTDTIQGILKGWVGSEYSRGPGQHVLRVLGCNRYETKNPATKEKTGTLLFGACGYGESGLASDIREPDGKQFSKSARGIDEIKLHYMIVVPELGGQALLLVQKLGRRGMKTLLDDVLGLEFKKQQEHYKIVTKPMVPVAYLRELELGRISRVSFLKHRKGLDRFKNFFRAEDEDSFLEEVSYRPLKRQLIVLRDAVLNYFYGSESDLATVLEGYEDVKIEIPYGGSKRKISLKTLDDQAWSIDVTSKIEVDEGGHPTAASLVPEMRKVAADVYEQFGNKDLSGVLHPGD